MKRIFLTGGTGVLGSYVLKDLLLRSNAIIYCLVRTSDKADGRARLFESLQVYDGASQIADLFDKRVHVLIGEVNKPGLGLDFSQTQLLYYEIDLVIHVAANTNLFARYTSLYGSNVLGTKNVVDFTLKTKKKSICYVSSFSVMGDSLLNPVSKFSENEFDIGQKFTKSMSYQRSKFEAEKIVRASTDLGLKWIIVRPGQIFGDSETGQYPDGLAVQPSSLFYDIFKTIIETRLAFHSDWYFDITPVDYVSRAIVYLCMEDLEFFKTFHLNNPDIKTFSEILHILKSTGRNFEIISIQNYQKYLVKGKLLYLDTVYRSQSTRFLSNWILSSSCDFKSSGFADCKQTVSRLTEAKIYCPVINARLLGLYTSKFREFSTHLINKITD
ncbi:MAG: thioester reductase domain-containing protein [Bdellovibrionales bacterium]